MAIRTDDDMVKAVLAPGGDYDLVLNPALTRFIKISNIIVNKVVTCASAKGVTISDEELLELETWLAAHYYKMSDQQLQSKSTNGASGSYRGSGTQGLATTTYGQSALDMETTGCLKQLTSGQRASATWLGVTENEALDWEDRQ